MMHELCQQLEVGMGRVSPTIAPSFEEACVGCNF